MFDYCKCMVCGKEWSASEYVSSVCIECSGKGKSMPESERRETVQKPEPEVVFYTKIIHNLIKKNPQSPELVSLFDDAREIDELSCLIPSLIRLFTSHMERTIKECEAGEVSSFKDAREIFSTISVSVAKYDALVQSLQHKIDKYK